MPNIGPAELLVLGVLCLAPLIIAVPAVAFVLVLRNRNKQS